MTALSLDRDTILRRLNGIQSDLAELRAFAAQPLDEFSTGVGFKLAQFHLHRALEGVFHITSHILSRIPGAQASEYKAMACKLGEVGVVDPTFASKELTQMAGYRNRLVHFYADIKPAELHDILKQRLGDFDIFFEGVKRVLENPPAFGVAL